MPAPRRSIFRLIAALGPLLVLIAPTAAPGEHSHVAALASITAEELYAHVATLSDDVFEGRAVGTRGGHAAAQYILQQLRQYRLIPAGDDGFFHACDRGGRNILAVWPGTDPRMQHQYIIVGAHYDHVGNGSQGPTRGSIGSIHNGADDNASGVAMLLETIQALTDSNVDTRRSLLFAFWDGEEVGLVGSKDWIARPTVPLEAVRLAINLDMVGRLRDGRLQVLGTRTGYGLRRLFSRPLDESLRLDFSWELSANSDHWPFIENQVPSVMLHTGLHHDYHRPTDDAEKINRAGMEQVGRYLLTTLIDVANADELPSFRHAGRSETLATQQHRERQLAVVPAAHWVSLPRNGDQRPGDAARPRLGIAWRTDDAESGSVYLTHVVPSSPAAAAGLTVDDRIYAVNGRPLADAATFRAAIVAVLDAGADFTLEVESHGHVRTITIPWQSSPLTARAST